MINITDGMQELLDSLKYKLAEKNSFFKYDIYFRFDETCFLCFDFFSPENDQIIRQYYYPLGYFEEHSLDDVVEEVVEKSKQLILNNIKDSGNWIPENNKIVLVLDIMGFKNMVSSLPNEDVYLKLYRIFTFVKRTFNLEDDFYNRFWVELFSDTIFIITNDCSIETIRILNIFVSGILYISLRLGIMFKGAFAEGKIIVDRKNHICFGQPIIDAYLLVEKQAWFGIVCHESVKSEFEKNIKIFYPFETEEPFELSKPTFIPYDVPLKQGIERLTAFAWFNLIAIPQDEIKSCLTSLKEKSPKQVKVYYDRLFEFMDYCESKECYSKFEGNS